MALEARLEFEQRVPRMPGVQFKEFYTFDESLQRLGEAGYARHARPGEFFDRIVRRLDRSLESREAELAKDMDDCPEWLSLAALWTKGRVVLFEEPTGLYWREVPGMYDVDDAEFRAGGKAVYDLRTVHPERFIDITDGAGNVTGQYVPAAALARVPGIVEQLWSRPFDGLPGIIQERGVLELPAEGVITPMQFDHPGYAIDEGELTGYAYSICCGVKSGSRGVREVR